MKIIIEEVFDKSDKEIQIELDKDGDLEIEFAGDIITISIQKLQESIKFLQKQ